MGKAFFSMAFHCYQPVFNFDWEIENAYKKAYLPLLETLEEFPLIKASFHYSGNMLEWFSEKHPEYIDKIGTLLKKRQIELIGGGCFEPIMTLIPERDREEQLKVNSGIISGLFGVKPEGAWLAERVWQPSLADTFSRAGMKYTIVDDYHILGAGVNEKEIFAPYVTRGEKNSITLFPSLTQLRYFLPFQKPAVILDYFKKNLEARRYDNTYFFFADDGEKFGAWPYTYDWVHRRLWLKKFLTSLMENSDWLKTATYSEILAIENGKDIGTVPESSYAEMMEWSGGSFNNFLRKYPEANRMHKRMIFVSGMIDRAILNNGSPDASERLSLAKRELFKAQTSCAYWHGTFGGFYLPHLRSGVYKHLIKAQDIVESVLSKNENSLRAVRHDLDECASEIVISNKFLNVFIKSFDGGVVSELDYKRLQANLANTISRVKEDYHKKLDKDYSPKIKEARKAVLRGETVDIHDVLGLAERGLRRVLAYDGCQRHSFMTHIFKEKSSWKRMLLSRVSHDRFLKGRYISQTEADKGQITCSLSKRDKIFTSDSKPADIEVVKKITVDSDAAVAFSHKILNHSDRQYFFKYAVEFNFLIWDKAASRRPRLMRTDRFSLTDKYSDVKLEFTFNKKFYVFTYPIYSVNETERGLKKMFQGISVSVCDESLLAGVGDENDMKIVIKVG